MRYAFCSCRVDTDTRELHVGGDVRELEPQVFDLLVYLLAHRDRVVSRDELVTHVWNGRVVGDSAIDARINAARRAVGDSGKAQCIIKTIPRRGHRFVAEVELPGGGVVAQVSASCAGEHRTHFCTSRDGTRIAFAQTGSGSPLVRTGHYLTHLELDWPSPVWGPFLAELGQHFRVTRYDQRGGGLSDWAVDDFCLERFVEDLEAVIDAAKLERFDLYGASQGAPVSIVYAVRHPGRVSRLILHGGYAQGRMMRGDAEQKQVAEAVLTLIRQGWGVAGSAYVKALSTLFIPEGTPEQIEYLATMQRQSTTAENAAALRASIDHFDVSSLLDQVRVPTLVIHANKDSIHPMEQGLLLAARIRGAEFVMLDSANHVMLRHDTAWSPFFDAIRRRSGEAGVG